MSMSTRALPLVDTMMNMMGLKIVEIDNDTKIEIERMIDMRNKLRTEKKFQDADDLRHKILELYDVELTDHTKYTSWKKKENIEFDRK
jgi:cysteinyl-tRNA synthetase